MSDLLTMTGISKRFGATQALADVSLSVPAGRVLALIGENGAGKSTLMKVLSGAHGPDSGSMLLAGRPYAPSGPHDARLAGVSMIYQELNLAPDLSVEDNIMLGQEARRVGSSRLSRWLAAKYAMIRWGLSCRTIDLRKVEAEMNPADILTKPIAGREVHSVACHGARPAGPRQHSPGGHS